MLQGNMTNPSPSSSSNSLPDPSHSSCSSSSSSSSPTSTSSSSSSPFSSISSRRIRVGKYELGDTLGRGSFGKVKLARCIATGRFFAIKILDKEKIVKHQLCDQIKREIVTMKLVKHPHIVRLYEIMATKAKVYFVLEYASGGELLRRIKRGGKLSEEEARRFFQQLLDAMNYCHSIGVYHRDLKPENLLLDASGNLKISDFGLSALKEQCWNDGLLHTACGTPNYVAPEVLCNKGYDGAKADLWSCGVILFILMTGFLPFDDGVLTQLYRKIIKGEFKFPEGFPDGAQKLIKSILTTNPNLRITMSEVFEDPWFKEGYNPCKSNMKQEFNSLFDINVDMVLNQFDEHLVTELKEIKARKPSFLNAFELISFSSGLNLSGLFEETEVVKRRSSFTSEHPASEIIAKMEAAAKPLGFNVKKQGFKLRLEGVKTGREGHLSIETEVFQAGPSLFVVKVQKTEGNAQEYNAFCQQFSTELKDIIIL